MDKEQKKNVIKIIISLLIFIVALLIPEQVEVLEITKTVLLFGAYLMAGYGVIKEAIESIFEGHIFEENFLMTIATIGAIAIGEFPEAVMVMWLYQVGEAFQKYAVGKSRASITGLMNLRPDYANIKIDGKIIEVLPEKVSVGDIIIVKPGEKVPIDGVVIEGESALDTMALTGESIPKIVCKDMEIFSGTINKTGLLEIRTTKTFKESTVSKILELVENASDRKANTENFITRFARVYTPIVVFAALCLAFIPPLFSEVATWAEYIYRACSFLVISCPCALVISIPLSFFAGIGGASKVGVLIKGSNYLENLSKIKYLILDKTGTLTKGKFEVSAVNAIGINNDELLEITALAEAYSEHPIAISIKNAYGKEIEISNVKNVEDISGYGVIANVNDKKVCVGNKKLMQREKIEIADEHNQEESNSVSTKVYVSVNGIYTGHIVIEDKIKEESYALMNKLNADKLVKDIVMLTGDNENVAKDVAEKLGINTFFANLLPAEKVNKVEEILKTKGKNESLAFVGDGINDAPVLARADIGIAMGALGADAAIEAADIVIMDDDISKISTAISISKRTLRIVKQNIVFSIGAKIVILILSALGLTTLWGAIFADVGVLCIAVINAIRAMDVKVQ